MRSTLLCVGYGQLATRNIREEQMSESTTIHSRSTESTGLTAPMMYSCIFIISSFFVVECHAMHTPTTVYFGELMFNPSLPTLPPPFLQMNVYYPACLNMWTRWVQNQWITK